MGHSHSHQLGQANSQDIRSREIRKVTLVGSAVDLILGIAKIIGGVVSNSQALIADGIHSLSDLATDVIVLYAMKHSVREADEEHPYGHARIETVATVVLGIALLAVAVGIALDAIDRLFHIERLLQPGMIALLIAIISVVSKEIIYHYSMVIARKYRSNLLKANAWHSRSDAISSVIVVIGVLGSMAGLSYLDAIAAVGVSFMIAKIGWDLSLHSLRELIDTGLEPERVDEIRKSILAVDGVHSLHVLRTRRMGGDALVDVHIQVNPRLSVSEGHHISEAVRARVIEEIDEVADVMVHIDPEDDELVAKSMHLPMRQAILNRLKVEASAIEGITAIRDEDITLHYLDGKIRINLVLPFSLLENDAPAARKRIAAQFDEVASKIDDIKSIEVSYQ